MRLRRYAIISLVVVFSYLIGAVGVNTVTLRRGGFDDGIPPYAVGNVVPDIGILQAALLGFSPLDGRGRPLFIDTFKEGLSAWRIQNTGAGLLPTAINGQPIAGAVNTENVFIAPISIRLNAGAVANDTSTMQRVSLLGQSTRIGLEVTFLTETAFTADLRFLVAIQPVTGTGYQMELRYTASTDQWNIVVLGGGTVLVTTTIARVTWATVKIVGDFATGKFVRMILGETVFDISANSMPTFSGTAGQHSSIIRAVSNGAALPWFIGAAIITRDEP